MRPSPSHNLTRCCSIRWPEPVGIRSAAGVQGAAHNWRQMELPPEELGPGPREYHTLTALSGGRLLVFGGANDALVVA